MSKEAKLIKVDPETWRVAKARAITLGEEISQFVEVAITDRIAATEQAAQAATQTYYNSTPLAAAALNSTATASSTGGAGFIFATQDQFDDAVERALIKHAPVLRSALNNRDTKKKR